MCFTLCEISLIIHQCHLQWFWGARIYLVFSEQFGSGMMWANFSSKPSGGTSGEWAGECAPGADTPRVVMLFHLCWLQLCGPWIKWRWWKTLWPSAAHPFSGRMTSAPSASVRVNQVRLDHAFKLTHLAQRDLHCDHPKSFALWSDWLGTPSKG